ncbi:hypothetical protein ANTRET_LOCUS3449 [Anthophora retusa]
MCHEAFSGIYVCESLPRYNCRPSDPRGYDFKKMAPHMQRVCHGIGDPGRYPLRTLKHSENFLRPGNVDVSKINGKEGFFHSIGLQMKRFQYKYKTLNGSCSIRTINIPNGVMLRDCSVVILGTTCRLCGQCFKCETDLNIHIALTHQTYSNINGTAVKATQCTEDETEMCKKITKSFDRVTTLSEKNFTTKLHKKLHLTLKIGEEIVAKISMKRKHLKVNTANRCTQTEQYGDTKLSMDKDVCESVISDIDPPVFCNSPYQCCNSSIDVVNSPNRYAVSNIVANEQTACEETIAYEGNHVPFKLNESCAKFPNEKCGAACNDPLNTVPLESNIVPTTEKDSLQHSNSKNASIFSEKRSNSIFTETSKSVSNFQEKHDSTKPVTNSVNSSSERMKQSQTNDSRVNGRSKDVSVNETQTDINIHEKNKCVSEKQLKSVPKVLQVIIPVILPIVVSNKNISDPSPVKLMIQPAESQQQQEKKLQEIQKTYTVNIEDHSDEEVQEVLRIIRGRSNSTEINHESPNRVEQEMLLQDAIKDMKRMEDQGWHLLEKDVTPIRKKKRIQTNAKSSGKSNEANDECAKKKQKISVQSNSKCNVVRQSVGEKYISDAREHISKVQNDTTTMCQLDNAKESLTMCNGVNNIDASFEELHRCGINYNNEVFEINNNTTKSVQKPVSPFLVPCSGGTENRGNRPAIIDLVNDTDE